MSTKKPIKISKTKVESTQEKVSRHPTKIYKKKIVVKVIDKTLVENKPEFKSKQQAHPGGTNVDVFVIGAFFDAENLKLGIKSMESPAFTYYKKVLKQCLSDKNYDPHNSVLTPAIRKELWELYDDYQKKYKKPGIYSQEREDAITFFSNKLDEYFGEDVCDEE